MDTFEQFSSYFKKDFWRAFKKKGIVIAIPSTSEKNEIIAKVYEDLINNCFEVSAPNHFIYLNKGHGVTRVIPVFEIRDYIVYYYCIKKLEKEIAINRVENTFGGWSLGGLMRKSEDEELTIRKINYDSYEEFVAESAGFSVTEYSFNPLAWAKAYGDLNAKLYATAQETDYGYVAELDIANFYDSIRLDVLKEYIQEVSTDEFIIDLLFDFLDGVNKQNKHTLGLPMDAIGDCSRILANFYLHKYDKYMFEICDAHHWKYLRYADDQFVFVEKEYQLEYIVFKASKWLGEIGLSINQKKVEFYKTEELIENRSFKIFSILSEKEYENDKEKVEEFADEYLRIVDTNGLENIKKRGNPLLSKLLFCPALRNIDNTKKTRIISALQRREYLRECSSEHFHRIYDLLDESGKRRFLRLLAHLSLTLLHNSFHYQLYIFYEDIGVDTTVLSERLAELEDE